MKTSLLPFPVSSSLRALRVAVVGLILSSSAVTWAAGEQRFASPETAVSAFVAAAKDKNTNELQAIFGAPAQDFLSPDVVQATTEFELFTKRLSEKTELTRESDTKVTLQIGADGWPFPIPLVKQDNQWFFDTAAGKEEIHNRRIGKDELATIRVCHAYVDAQREYASQDRDGDEVLEYAQKLRSDPGQKNGLYWPLQPGDDPSPFGPLLAQARAEGYRRANKIMTDTQAPYHGYFFKILTRQGPHAPGGRYHYVINGNMIGGFALVAWPSDWGNTGVMTFIVNQQGKVYQKNLGPKTASLAAALTTYDPDSTWTPVIE